MTGVQKLKTFIERYGHLLLYIKLGVIAGVIPSTLNHLGEFWKWSFAAKTADQYGFWVIFVVLIILKSRNRKYAVLNTVVFCLIMCIVYGLVETLFKVPFFFLQPSKFLNLFLEYELAQAYWFAVIMLLVPVAWIIYSAVYPTGKNRVKGMILKIMGGGLVILPLLNATVSIIKGMNLPKIVCAEIATGWKSGLCLLQQPDGWIIGNYVIEAAIYVGFVVFWVWFMSRPLTLNKKHPSRG